MTLPSAWFSVISVIGLIIMSSFSFPVLAQSKDTIATLEEIVVTARKREENLQDTPIAVTALNAEAIEERNMVSVSEITQYAPNIQFDNAASESGGGGSSQISIRGIGQTDYVITVEPGVGLYLDGVYIGKSVGSLIDTVDLAGIQVLRGPQGTLFGKNTIGGAIVLTSKKPSDEKEFLLDVTTGTDDRIDVKTSMSGAVSERLRLRFSGASQNRDGHVERVLTGDSQGDKESWSGRFIAEFDVTDNFLATFTADGTHANEPSPGQVLVRADNTQGFANFHVAGDFDNRFVAPIDDLHNFSTGDNRSDYSVWGTNLTLEWDAGPFSLKSITAYRDVETLIEQDLTLNPSYVNEIGQDIKMEQVSQELQLYGTAFDERLEYLVGFFYLNEKGSQSFPVLLDAAEFISGGEINNDSSAIFAQGTYEVTDRLGLTIGARYTHEQREFTPVQPILQISPTVIGLFGLFGFPPEAFAPGTPLYPRALAEDTDGRFTTSVTLDYQLSDDMLGYFTFSQGFKGGGFTMRGFPPAIPGLTPGLPAGTEPASLIPRFDPETVELFELGLKSQLFNNRMRLNLAGFVTNYDDVQLLANTGLLAFVPVIVNAGDARLWGIEAETDWLVTNWLRINGSLGWTDHEYRKLLSGVAGITLDSRLPNAPKWTTSLGATIDLMNNDKGHIFIRGDWSYKSKQFKDSVNTLVLEQDAYHQVNLSVSWRSPGQHLLATLGATNLADEIYIVSGVDNTGIGYGQAVVSRPRELFLRLKYEY